MSSSQTPSALFGIDALLTEEERAMQETVARFSCFSASASARSSVACASLNRPAQPRVVE